jgi:hypothetical protein
MADLIQEGQSISITTLSSREKRNDGTMRKRTSNILPIIIDAMNESISQNQSHRESKCN